MSEPFYFSNCGQAAHNVEDLADLCQQFSREAIDHLNQGHFESWLSYIGETSLASKTAAIRQSPITNEERLKQFLNACQLSQLPSKYEPEQKTVLPSVEEPPLPPQSKPEQKTVLPSVEKPQLTRESKPEQKAVLPSVEKPPLPPESKPEQEAVLPSVGKSFQPSSKTRFCIRYFPGLGPGKIYRVGEQELIVNYSQLSRQIRLIHRNGGKIQDIVAI